jgi:hypothetical protein
VAFTPELESWVAQAARQLQFYDELTRSERTARAIKRLFRAL